MPANSITPSVPSLLWLLVVAPVVPASLHGWSFFYWILDTVPFFLLHGGRFCIPRNRLEVCFGKALLF